MRFRLPVLILLSVICFLFFIPSPLVAQEASPTVSPASVSQAGNPIIDFLKNLLAAITGGKVDTTMEDFNKANLPGAVRVIPAKQPKEEKSEGESFRATGEGEGEGEEEMPDTDPIYNAASQYTASSWMQTPKGEEERTTNLADSFAGIVDDPEKVVEKGDEKALELLETQLPMGMAEKALSRVKQSSGIADNISGRSAQVLGYTTFSGDKSVMSDVKTLLECSELPGYLCKKLTESGKQPVPSPTPTSVPPTTPQPTPSGRCSLGTDYCSVDYLNKDEYFSDINAAKIASQICNVESGGGDPLAVNDHCLEKYPVSKRTHEYSVGLFQINVVFHLKSLIDAGIIDKSCTDIIIDEWQTNRRCIIPDFDRFSECIAPLKEPANNIKYAVILSKNGTVWTDWSAAKYCGIVDGQIPPLPPQPPPPQEPIQVAGCPPVSTMLVLPGTQFYLQNFDHGCITPRKIVIHWSGGWSSAKATADWLREGVIKELGYPLACHLATDKDIQLQLLQYFDNRSQKGECTGGANDGTLNNEITGKNFDEVISNPDHVRYQELIQATDKAVQTTCWMLKKYNIQKSEIYGHYQLTPGKSDPGVEYLKYFKQRVENECH